MSRPMTQRTAMVHVHSGRLSFCRGYPRICPTPAVSFLVKESVFGSVRRIRSPRAHFKTLLRKIIPMGSWFTFTCKDCGYGETLAGGKDWGMVSVVRTMVCQKCKIMTDVVIGEFGRELRGDPRFGKCRKCRARKHLVPWKRGTPCPKCGGRMPKGPCVAVWD